MLPSKYSSRKGKIGAFLVLGGIEGGKARGGAAMPMHRVGLLPDDRKEHSQEWLCATE